MKNVQTLPPINGRAALYFDADPDAPAGFALRVRPSGARSFYFVYRSRAIGKAKRWVSLGEVGASGGLAAARGAAREARELLRRGIDPIEERERQAAERKAQAARVVREAEVAASRPSVSGLVEAFIKGHEGRYAEKTLAEYRRMQRAYLVKAPLAEARAADVRRHQVREFLGAVALKNGPTQANRLQQLIRAAFTWGVVEELDEELDRNPAAGWKVAEEERLPAKDRVLDAEEVRRLWLALGQPTTLTLEEAAFVQLLLLTGLRRTEATLAVWSDVSLEASTREWVIPAPNRKAAGRRGRSAIRRELVVPLSRPAVSILKALCSSTGPTGPVFGPVGAKVRANPHRFIQRVRAAVGVEGVVLHDLRATCATGVADCGAAPYVVSLVLGHAVLPGAADATPLYDRSARLAEVRAALEAWAARVKALAEAKEGKTLAWRRLA